MAKHIAEGITMSSAAEIKSNSGKISGLSTALVTAATDAATKGYVDSVAQGLDVKGAVIAAQIASDGNKDVSTGGLAQTLDGIAVNTDGDRLLLKHQTNQAENGIWIAHAGAWTRPADFATGDGASGAFCFIEQGGTLADTGWVCDTDAPNDIIDTNNLSFTQFSTAGVVTAGDGLTKTANEIAAVADDGISVSSSGIKIDLPGTSGLSVDGSGLVLADGVAGAGLVISSKVLAVGAGSGISVSANAIALGSLTGAWDAGSWQIRAETFQSDIATGTAPFTVASTTVITNLNADLLDGQSGTYYAVSANVLLKDGSVALTADWDAGSFEVRAATFQSDIATGTAPFIVASTTVVANLNASTVGGKSATDIVLRNGTQALTANWDAGSFKITAETFASDIAIGTAPFTVVSTTVVTNLNADLLDGQSGTYYAVAANVLLKDGTVALTANWDVGAYTITALRFVSDVTSGTAPFTVASNTVVTNLNADLLDGQSGTYYAVAANALLKDGSVALTADWDAGSFEIRSSTFESDVVTGTAPFTIASTTVSANLNADLLDGSHASAFLLLAGGTMAGTLNMGTNEISNAGTISTLANGNLTLAPNGTGYTVTTKDVRIDASGAGVVLKDTSGTFWRLGVTTDGVLTTTSL